jgi:hypothetical protein
MTTSRAQYTSQLVWGGILLILGTALLLNNLDLLEMGSVWRYWPLLIVAMGIGKLVMAESARERGSAIWLIFIGAWLYISVFRIFGFGFHDSWPILLVGVGVSMVVRSAYRQSLGENKETSHE